MRLLHSLPVLAGAAFFALAPLASAAEKLQYNRDIRPILAENCFACHGPDSAARKADLRLDQRDLAIESKSIVPGKPDSSPVVERIFAEDETELMPPPKSHKKLTTAQKNTLRRWIQEGAEYQPHWSFIPPTRPAVPAVQGPNLRVANPIDAFIASGLQKARLSMAPEADRRTLARRLSLDLNGLPPNPADVEAFVNDKSPNAYEKYVDQLLASSRWGEHRGRYWLDAARYADTHGIHFDNYREIWAYRDWVINAFNKNQPFDRFTIEQLAGDLLPNPTLDQLVATGFNRCNITTNEGGIIDEEYVVLYARDRTETVNQVWMGLTAGCAVCHDHKFDPISMRDFYSMSAFFNNTTQGARDGNIPNTPPIITVPMPGDRARLETLSKELAEARKKLEARKPLAKKDFAKWLKTVKAEDVANKIPTDNMVLHAPLDEHDGKTIAVTLSEKEQEVEFDPTGYEWSLDRAGKKAFTIRAGKAVEFKEVGDFEKDQPFAVSAWVSISKRGGTGAILGRMDEGNGFRGWDVWMEGDRIGMHIISTWQDDALKVVAKAPLVPKKWYHVTVAFDGSGKADGVKIYYDGEPQPVDVQANSLKSTIRTKIPLKIGQRSTGSRMAGVGLEDLRVYSRTITPLDAKALAGNQRTAELVEKGDKRNPKEEEELFAWWVASLDEASKEFTAAVSKLQAEEVGIRSRGTIAHIMTERSTPAEAYILFRGVYDKRRDKVGAETPKALPSLPKEAPKNRLGSAQWLLRPDHPLTARVTVNRFWQEVFGTGLVRTAGDFGITGELPGHPELLDWLAVEFRETGWDVKKFFKMIVMSETYRQSAATTREKLDKDPDNRLLSRGPRFRMDAEMVRDYALATSGLLIEKIGGPSVKPYQPDRVWEAVAMIGSNTRNYKRDAGENLYRRSLYTFWKRSAPPAFLDVMNAPNRETCVVRRDRTNTPLQALLTLNDVQHVEAARVLAEKTLKEGGASDDAKLDFLAKRLLARPFRAEEVTIVKGSLKELLAAFQAKPDDAKKLISYGESKADEKLDPSTLAGWTMLVNELMNLDEVLTK